MTVLVTGATGFIGRRLVSRLCSEAVGVRALVLPGEDASFLEKLEGVEIVRGDVTDRSAVAASVDGAERVYHLAAIVGDWGDEEAFVRVNVEGTRNVLDAAARVGCRRVLMVSSIVVYGWQLHTSVCDEEAPRELGVSPYSRTKRASEALALDYHSFGRVPVTVVRPGNVYGPGSSIWVDTLVEHLRAGSAVHIDAGEGDAVLAYVDNVVDVIVRGAASESAAGKIYNANDGSGVSWRQYVADLAAIAGVDPPRRNIPSRLALASAIAMEQAWRLARRRARPLLTREAVTILASREPVPIARAARELGYRPPVSYREAMDNVAQYVQRGSA